MHCTPIVPDRRQVPRYIGSAIDQPSPRFESQQAGRVCCVRFGSMLAYKYGIEADLCGCVTICYSNRARCRPKRGVPRRPLVNTTGLEFAFMPFDKWQWPLWGDFGCRLIFGKPGASERAVWDIPKSRIQIRSINTLLEDRCQQTFYVSSRSRLWVKSCSLLSRSSLATHYRSRCRDDPTYLFNKDQLAV